MVTNKFNSYTEKDLRTIVEGLSNDTVQCTISELKELQSELINRRSEPQQIASISHLIMRQIAGGRRDESSTAETMTIPAVYAPSFIAEEKSVGIPTDNTRAYQIEDDLKVPVIKPSTAKIDQLRPRPINKKEMIEEDDEKFPVLRFLILFYKIIGWLGVAVILGGFTITAIYYLQGSTAIILCGSGMSLVASAIFLLIFSALSENILWKLEVEKMLRKD